MVVRPLVARAVYRLLTGAVDMQVVEQFFDDGSRYRAGAPEALRKELVEVLLACTNASVSVSSPQSNGSGIAQHTIRTVPGAWWVVVEQRSGGVLLRRRRIGTEANMAANAPHMDLAIMIAGAPRHLVPANAGVS